jgi:plasmid stabilization system protein ParE
MKHRVHLTRSASADAQRAYDWLAPRAPRAAVKWFNGLFGVIDTLERFPRKCGLARESAQAPEEIRQLLYGRRPHIYRILFIIRGEDVYVLHIRHGARQAMHPEEIEFPPP